MSAVARVSRVLGGAVVLAFGGGVDDVASRSTCAKCGRAFVFGDAVRVAVRMPEEHADCAHKATSPAMATLDRRQALIERIVEFAAAWKADSVTPAEAGEIVARIVLDATGGEA